MKPSTSPIKKTDHYPLFTFVGELDRIKDDPRLLVLVAHGVVELFVSAIVEAKCRNGRKITPDGRGYPHSARLIILNEIGVLTDSQLRLYDWFRKLRNRAAHDPLFSLTDADLSLLKEKYRDAAKFHKVCQYLVIGLWNLNISVLVPRFMPGLKGFHEARMLESKANRRRNKGGAHKTTGPKPPPPDVELLQSNGSPE